MAKAKDAKKSKKSKKGEAADPQAERIVRLRAHPRARRQIATAKGWGGLIGFAFTLWRGLGAGEPTFNAGLHALVAGVVLYVVAWTVAVTIWRHLAVAEVRAARQRADAESARRIAEAEAMAAQARAAEAQAAGQTSADSPLAQAA